jgi:Mrp family chromosome partitioning ATPase
VPDRHPADVIAFALPRALDALRSDDGLIVLDSPPLSGIAETAYIATVARHVILVLDPSGSNLPELERSMARLRESGVVLLGVVLNGTRRRRGRRSNPYYNFEYAAAAPVMDERELAAPSGGRVRSSR